MKCLAILLLALTCVAQTAPPRAAPRRGPVALPAATVGQAYQHLLQLPGHPAPLAWLQTKGMLPPGLKLEADGLISGTPTNGGTYVFTVSVRDGASMTTEHEYSIRVSAQFAIEWRRLPAINGAKIEGTVRVTNSTADIMDLTVVIVAVNQLNKAFTLGYQRFPFRPGAIQDIPFGTQITLPLGQYIVHADAVGEVPSKNLIVRSRQRTERPLVVMQQ